MVENSKASGGVSQKNLVIWPVLFLLAGLFWAWEPGPVQTTQTVEAPIPPPVVVRAMPVVPIPRPEMPAPGSAQVRQSFSIPLAPHK